MRYVNISIGTMDSFLMNKAVQEVREMGYDIDYRNFDNTDLDEDPLFLADAIQFISGADFVTIKVHGDTTYCKKFDKIRDALEVHHVCMHLSCTDDCVTEAFRDFFLGTDEEYDLVMRYTVLGGNDNFISLLKWALNRFDGLNLAIDPPKCPLTEGVYYPGKEPFTFSDYISGLDPDKPNIGIFFYQKQWVNGNLDNIDGLIRAVERLANT